MSGHDLSPRKRRKLSPPEPGPYVLRNIVGDIPLRADDSRSDSVSITCLEYWNSNLYVGTSASEILHLVALPPDPTAGDSSPTHILASRLQPSGHDNAKDALGRQGVQQILILPSSSKACVLCNGTVSFYSLPELSPAFPNREPTGVQWIGGLDENADRNGSDEPVVMVANSKRIMLVKVGEKLRSGGNAIEYPGCLQSSRRDTIACVADGRSYSLLEVQHQQKIPLFPISSAAADESNENPSSLSASSPTPREHSTSPGHGRSTSLGNLIGSVAGRTRSPRPQSFAADPSRPLSNDSLQPTSKISRQIPSPGPESPGTRQRSSTDTLPANAQSKPEAASTAANLKPHILSPFASEFMLTTGTGPLEPGVGMFVNVDGDVVRGTVQFLSYPEDIMVDDAFPPNTDVPRSEVSDQVIIALLKKTEAYELGFGVDIQPLPGITSENRSAACWIRLPSGSSQPSSAGLHKALDYQEYTFERISELLQAIPLGLNRSGVLSHFDPADEDPRTSSAVEQLEQEKALFDNGPSNAVSAEVVADVINTRLEEEKKFVQRFGQSKSRQMIWDGNTIWHLFNNPVLLQLESQIVTSFKAKDNNSIEASTLLRFLGDIRNREATSEVEFLSLNYARQKASLILFLHLLSLLESNTELANNQSPVEQALHESGLDPRIILLMISPLSNEVSYGSQGIWLHQGIVDVAAGFQSPIQGFEDAPVEFWMMIRHFLTLWQEKRGYGSITDEKLVFDSVDAALLHILLYLDQALPKGSGVQVSARAKLNNVVDHWKGDFDRAASLLERYQRLYVLSRLYQSKKQAKEVLGTWRRIIEGEPDVDYAAGSTDLEIQIKRYLNVIRDQALVQEYGLYLAHRNPDLGIQVFAEDTSRVKFDPHQVVSLLKQYAPHAVQQYLEHLVFSKNLDRYADDLIGYYLDSVLSVLESSEEARDSLAQTYSAYRALSSPKPTYLNFIHENAPPEPWWQSRLRLLQLLGSGGYASAASSAKELSYSIPKVLERLAPFKSYLVSESIILDARQGRHKEALRLLTHGLGDYDTAVRYCYFGGPSAPSQPVDASALPSRELQEELFNYVFHQFLSIEDIEERLERTSQLLGKFATWFDPLAILAEIPDDWNVGMLSEFLLRSFRAATSKRNEAVIIKALSAAQNLQIQATLIEACEKVGATIEREKGIDGAGGHNEQQDHIQVS